MSQDQHTLQDPTTQHPDSLPADQIEHPGLESEMSQAPDFGEQTYRGSGKLEGRKAIITGGDSGIGRAVALAFAREGADVAISYLEAEQSDADETTRVIREAGRTAVQLPGDLTDSGYCRTLVEQATEQLGGVDILVNNAAYQMAQSGGIADITTEQFDRVMKTNLYAMFWLCKMALPHMRAGSSIINTSSVQASSPSPELLDYATTKAGIANFTRGLAGMVATQGVRVNSVAPGPIWTPLIPATMPPDAVESFGEQTPLGRAGQPVEVATAFVYLASAESSYVTGEVLAVTGGLPVTV
jgi:NAD(P)-dependent dehydrogenase (short-subunit alcohol dehydrogenase family)